MKAEEKAYQAKLRGKNVNKSTPVDIPGRKSLIFDDDDDEPAAKNNHSVVDDDQE